MIWSKMVYDQIEATIGINHKFFWHVGIKYREFLIRKLKGECPLEGMRIGKQEHWYATQERK
jgi:hypothetical protein